MLTPFFLSNVNIGCELDINKLMSKIYPSVYCFENVITEKTTIFYPESKSAPFPGHPIYM